MTRVDRIRQLTGEAGAEAALVTHPADIRWAVGFTGSNGLLVVTPSEAHFVTDGRYTTQAADEVTDAEIHVPSGHALADHVRDAAFLADVSSVAIQADRLTVSAFDTYRDLFPDVTFQPVKELLSAAVAAKSPENVEAVARAQRVTCEVFEALLPSVREGVTEQELAAEITYLHLKRGASAMSFEPIVASGARGALPHARPSGKALQAGELVVIDMGAYLDGYSSDLTRTVAVGSVPAAARAAYETVRRAQEAAFEVAEAGRLGGDLDRAARDVIEADGLGEWFSHSLGHGVGLDVHEWPRLSQTVEHVLPEGATVTIEPGVYVPGEFGVRIEDVIVLERGGMRNLTPLAHDLVVV